MTTAIARTQPAETQTNTIQTNKIQPNKIQPNKIQTTSLVLPAALQRIVLTGFMGAGKTTTGKLLAALLGWDFLDVDRHLEMRAGMSIPQLFEQHGEAHFRRLESTALASSLARRSVVLALGGGVPEQLTNRLLLEQTPGTSIVLLDAPFSTLYDRCMLEAIQSQEAVRPVLADPGEAECRFALRLPLYRRLAHHTVATAGMTATQVAEEALIRLAGQPG